MAIYAASQVSFFSLPSNVFAQILSVILPPATWVALFAAYRQSQKSKLAFALRIANYILPLLYTALITLAASDLRQEPLGCFLKDRWMHMFQVKDHDSIRQIQNALECCGFKSTVDMAYPLTNEGNDRHACEQLTKRTKSCEVPWRGQERSVLGLMMAVGIVGLACQVPIPNRMAQYKIL